MNEEFLDRLAIRDLVENWAVWRDACLWEKFRTVWHDDGVMKATWTQGTADEFIAMSKSGFEKGVRILHFLGGCSIELAGARAVVQTKMTITQRGLVHDVLCDVVCTGRFFDLLEKRDDRWALCCASRFTRWTGSTRWCRGDAGAGRGEAGELSGGVSASGVYAGDGGLSDQDGHAGVGRAAGGAIICRGGDLAGGWAGGLVISVG